MNKTSKHILSRLLLTAITGLSAQAFAFQPLITDDTGTQGAGGNQLEFSYGHDKTKTAGESERVHSVPVTYTRGLTDTSMSLSAPATPGYVRPTPLTRHGASPPPRSAPSGVSMKTKTARPAWPSSRKSLSPPAKIAKKEGWEPEKRRAT